MAKHEYKAVLYSRVDQKDAAECAALMCTEWEKKGWKLVNTTTSYTPAAPGGQRQQWTWVLILRRKIRG